MKKRILLLAIVATAAMVSGCTSLRTPATGERSGKVYYNTFMGLSIESAVYGDGFLIDPAK